jgi:hypothetical protein
MGIAPGFCSHLLSGPASVRGLYYWLSVHRRRGVCEPLLIAQCKMDALIGQDNELTLTGDLILKQAEEHRTHAPLGLRRSR